MTVVRSRTTRLFDPTVSGSTHKPGAPCGQNLIFVNVATGTPVPFERRTLKKPPEMVFKAVDDGFDALDALSHQLGGGHSLPVGWRRGQESGIP